MPIEDEDDEDEDEEATTPFSTDLEFSWGRIRLSGIAVGVSVELQWAELAVGSA
jgi:hypothetical protein